MNTNGGNFCHDASPSTEVPDQPLPSNSSSDDGGLHTPSKLTETNFGTSQSSISNFRLKRCTSTPVLPYTSTPLGFRPINNDTSVQIPIVGYEVMEERARFTVYKIKIENKAVGDSWFIFRRYTDFVRLNSKLKAEFPRKTLALPRKRWFGNNFSVAFIEERIHGLQRFIDSVTRDEELLAARSIRDFFCLDEPPSYNEVGEESRAIFEALEDTIYQLRSQLRLREAEVVNMRVAVTSAQERAVTITHRLQQVVSCDSCRDKVQDLSDELQRVLCLQFNSS